MSLQTVTNVRLREETNEEVTALAAEWFSGNKSDAIRDLITLGLCAWDLGIRRGCQMRRVDASLWMESCIKAVHEKWPDAEVSMSRRETYVMPDESPSPVDEVIYRMAFAPTPSARKLVLMAVEGIDEDYFTGKIAEILERS